MKILKKVLFLALLPGVNLIMSCGGNGTSDIQIVNDETTLQSRVTTKDEVITIDSSSTLTVNSIYMFGVDPIYKKNRYKSKLKWVNLLKQYMQVEYGAICLKGVEADDCVCYYKNKYESQGEKVIIASSDKDVLQIMNKSINYHSYYKNKEGKGRWRIEYVFNNDDEIELFTFCQVLGGDISDNVLGCARKGKYEYGEKTG